MAEMPPQDQPTSVPTLPADATTAVEEPLAEPVRASVAETMRVLTTVLAPPLLTGVIKRRPRSMRLSRSGYGSTRAQYEPCERCVRAMAVGRC